MMSADTVVRRREMQISRFWTASHIRSTAYKPFQTTPAMRPSFKDISEKLLSTINNQPPTGNR